MRTLSSSLLAAQQSSSLTPRIEVTISNKTSGVVRLDWERLYTGTEEDSPHAVTIPGDGSLIRIRATNSGTSRKLYRQRVTSPGSSSDFSSWTYLSIYNIMAVAACSLDAEVSLFWVHASTGQIDRIKSTDNGATWAAVDYPGYAPSGAVAQMAAAYKPNGDLALFFTDTTNLYVIKRVSGVWQARATWDKTTGTLTGVAATYNGDWKLLVSGIDSAGNYKVWSLIYGDGGEVTAGSWSTTLQTIISAPSDALFNYGGLFLDYPDVYRGIVSEIYTGSEAYTRPFHMNTLPGTVFLENRWREPVPVDLSSANGLAMAHNSSYAWLTTPFGVWQAGLTAVTLDLSSNVISIKHTALPDTGKVDIELRNDLGQYSTLPAPLDTGCQIDFSPGYRTAAGSEYSAGLTFTLQAYEHNTGPGKATLLLEASDGWTPVKDWIARFQFRWNQPDSYGDPVDEANVGEILTQILARCGLDLTIISESATASGFYPDFTISPGENGKTVIDRLLSFIPDLIFLEGVTACLVNPLATDASVYSYGTDHIIQEGRYRTGAYEINRVRTEGLSLMGEDFTFTEIEKSGDILQIVEDLNAYTTAKAHERGQAHLRKAAIEALGGAIRIPVNCGQQLYDVIDITDSRAGLAAAKRRVLGLALTYQPAKGTYEHKLVLGGV